MISLRDEFRWGLDPVYFAREALDFEPDPWQADLLRSQARRQSGKSSTAAILSLHTALFNPGALVILISPTQRQSSEIFRKTRDYMRRVPGIGNLPEDNQLSATLPNRSRVVSLPGAADHVRGYSAPALIVEDEAARCSDELFATLVPMQATVPGSRLVLLSTPAGQLGHFHSIWSEGQGWQKYRITADDCPRISQEFLEQQRATMGARWFEQEFHCQFLAAADAVFALDDILGCVIGDDHALLR